jgi:hypothetical protein
VLVVLLLGILLFLVGKGVSWWAARGAGRGGSGPLAAAPEPAPAASAPVAAHARDAAPPPLVAGDGLPFRDPGPTDSHDGPMHPHPITPERERIQRENQLIGAMNDAMDLNNGPKLRRILDEYRANYPEDPNQLQEGYRIIADCLEHPGATSRATGQAYYDRARGASRRLFVSSPGLETRD